MAFTLKELIEERDAIKERIANFARDKRRLALYEKLIIEYAGEEDGVYRFEDEEEEEEEEPEDDDGEVIRRLPGYPYECSECGRAFQNKQGYGHHMTSIHAKPYECPECEKRFKSPQWLSRHVNGAHGGTEEMKGAFDDEEG